ncbi:chemotaxis protein CheB, partial [Salmonella enterica subsp. enterica serovar Enteritidis]|nr:chemotaxis protein CheB [Salmonella enterica subsp. enterica serovar Enteritidis]
MLSKYPPPRFFIVAEENQQRLAFSDTIRSWGF